MADAYQALDSLRRKLAADRERIKEQLAEGSTYDQQLVGRAKALKAVIGDISDQIKQINGKEDDDGDGSHD